ncbi:helix-turn-helix transcriptional regulator [Micromonospora sp. R77]|uniref:helix-turn-helix domain-containing protein n=1 Tax=Micromonospora sp. R77 TaxID=2925836 RepID=UPI001F600B53|nr:helix-turn-helix transcriptional regulator [Micromonospora sp. R77]MCI4061820.1 helix-turn-helix transcriptional regulator [Micromonospora sp. R77]
MTPFPPSGPRLLGPFLAELRLARGWSQQRIAAELCAASGVPTLTRHEVSRWERQLRLPGDFWLGWLAVVLGVPGELLTDAAARSRRWGAPAGGPVGVRSRPGRPCSPWRTAGWPIRPASRSVARRGVPCRARTGRTRTAPVPGPVRPARRPRRWPSCAGGTTSRAARTWPATACAGCAGPPGRSPSPGRRPPAAAARPRRGGPAQRLAERRRR